MTDYGPHRAEDAPNAVVILQADRRSPVPARTIVAPMPAALVRQREQVNQLAAGLLNAGPPRPIGRPRPVQARADTERGRRRLVECASYQLRGQPVPLMWGGPRG